MNEPQASPTPETDELAESWSIHSDRERLKQCLAYARRLEQQRNRLVAALQAIADWPLTAMTGTQRLIAKTALAQVKEKS